MASELHIAWPRGIRMASEEEIKAVEKVLTGCVSKVLDKFKRSSRASADSDDDFKPLVKKPKFSSAR